jgi:hypothetical protein
MAASDFFSRWAKPATSDALPGYAVGRIVDAAPATEEDVGIAVEARLPTADDASRLQADSNFAPFMARGVDESVKRMALKKLFTDPHFNVMDGLDIYIGDYNTFVPMSAALVASLNHGKALLDPLSQLLTPLQSLVSEIAEPAPVSQGPVDDPEAPVGSAAEADVEGLPVPVRLQESDAESNPESSVKPSAGSHVHPDTRTFDEPSVTRTTAPLPR